jgi:hypothetical protein
MACLPTVFSVPVVLRTCFAWIGVVKGRVILANRSSHFSGALAPMWRTSDRITLVRTKSHGAKCTVASKIKVCVLFLLISPEVQIKQRKKELSPEVAITQFYSVVLRMRMPPCLNSGEESTPSVFPGQGNCDHHNNQSSYPTKLSIKPKIFATIINNITIKKNSHSSIQVLVWCQGEGKAPDCKIIQIYTPTFLRWSGEPVSPLRSAI